MNHTDDLIKDLERQTKAIERLFPTDEEMQRDIVMTQRWCQIIHEFRAFLDHNGSDSMRSGQPE
jgi:hypothetical protein